MDGRKGIRAGYRKMGPVQRFLFCLAIVAFLSSVAFFVVPLILSYVAEERSALSGLLLPDSKPTPVNHCGEIPSGANAIFLGNSVAYSTSFPYSVIKVGGKDVLEINKSGDKITVSAKFFSKDGKIVAELKENKFFINPNNYFRLERPNEHTLLVYDQESQAVLNVEFVSLKVIKMLGIFYFPGRQPIIINDDVQSFFGGLTVSNSCFGGGAGAIQID